MTAAYTPHTVDEFDETLSRVVRLVRRAAPTSDPEFLAVSILDESWANGVAQPSSRFVRQRCIDDYRQALSARRAREACSREHRTVEPSPVAQLELRDEVGVLLLSLTPTERKIIHARFFLENTIAEIARSFRLDPSFVSQTITVALYKMREMGQ